MKLEKVKRLADRAGVGWRQVYKYLNGKAVPAPRVHYIVGAIGGDLALWVHDGGEKTKKELFERADI